MSAAAPDKGSLSSTRHGQQAPASAEGAPSPPQASKPRDKGAGAAAAAGAKQPKPKKPRRPLWQKRLSYLADMLFGPDSPTAQLAQKAEALRAAAGDGPGAEEEKKKNPPARTGRGGDSGGAKGSPDKGDSGVTKGPAGKGGSGGGKGAAADKGTGSAAKGLADKGTSRAAKGLADNGDGSGGKGSAADKGPAVKLPSYEAINSLAAQRQAGAAPRMGLGRDDGMAVAAHLRAFTNSPRVKDDALALYINSQVRRPCPGTFPGGCSSSRAYLSLCASIG